MPNTSPQHLSPTPLTRAEVEAWPPLGPMSIDKARVLALFDRLEPLEAAFAAATPSLEAEALDAVQAANELLTHLYKVVPWGATFDLNISQLNSVTCLLPTVLAKAGRR